MAPRYICTHLSCHGDMVPPFTHLVTLTTRSSLVCSSLVCSSWAAAASKPSHNSSSTICPAPASTALSRVLLLYHSTILGMYHGNGRNRRGSHLILHEIQLPKSSSRAAQCCGTGSRHLHLKPACPCSSPAGDYTRLLPPPNSGAPTHHHHGCHHRLSSQSTHDRGGKDAGHQSGPPTSPGWQSHNSSDVDEGGRHASAMLSCRIGWARTWAWTVSHI